jgi:hypothetical protein
MTSILDLNPPAAPIDGTGRVYLQMEKRPPPSGSAADWAGL